MNIGDLVTLSARGRKLEVCWKWRYPSKAPVGLVLRIDEPRFNWDKNMKYVVKWVGDGPSGRERYHAPHWHRYDLKFVAKAKK